MSEYFEGKIDSKEMTQPSSFLGSNIYNCEVIIKSGLLSALTLDSKKSPKMDLISSLGLKYPANPLVANIMHFGLAERYKHHPYSLHQHQKDLNNVIFALDLLNFPLLFVILLYFLSTIVAFRYDN